MAAPGTGPTLPASRPIDLTERSVDSALREVADATHTALVIDPDATTVAACARIAVHAPAGTDPTALATLLGAALEPHGLRLERLPSGLVLRRVAGAPLPASCVTTPSYSPTAGVQSDPRVVELAAGIRRVSDTEVLVTRSTLDGLLADGALLARQARIVPHFQDGRADGFKLYGIRASSLAGVLGFQNGDTLHAVSGHELTSPDHALEAYRALRGADRVVVELDRRGQPLRVTYRVVARLPAPPR